MSVLVDLHLALGHDIQCKPTVLSKLVEHVVEERQAGGYLWCGRHIQIQLHAHAGLAGAAPYQCMPRRIDQGMRDSRPVPLTAKLRRSQIGRASSRERVWQYV